MRLLHVLDGIIGLGGRQTYLDEFIRRSRQVGWQNDVCESADLHGGSSPRLGAPDVVLIHAATGWDRIAEACGSIPCVAWAHNHDAYCPGGMSWYPTTGAGCDLHVGASCLVNAYLRHCAPRDPRRLRVAWQASRSSLQAVERLQGVITGSLYMRNRLVGAGVPAAMVDVVPYFPRWDPTTEPLPPVADDGKPLIFCPTRLHPTKGVAQLIDALSFVDTRTEVVIAGSGSPDYVDELRRQASSLSGYHDISFVGSCNDDLRALYGRSSVVVVPSAWPEPFGLIGLEAMAFARPVVAFDVGGISDWLPDGVVGLLLPPGDTRAFGQGLEYLVSNPERAATMGAAGHSWVGRFSWRNHLRRIEGVLRRRSTKGR